MRSAYADALVEAGNDPRLFVLDADCASSTQTQRFQARFPGRFANAGIAEQNMVGLAAGLASVGFRPVVNAFAAMLVHRAHEQLMQSVGLTSANVVVAGHYAGVSSGIEGAPHHAISDVALMRAIPGMQVWWPCDDAEAAAVTSRVLDPRSDGPHYLRLERNPVPGPRPADAYTQTERRWGQPGQLLVVAAGSVATACVAAADGLPATCVVSLSRVEPLERGLLDDAAQHASTVITVEEHRRVGGLASALLEAGVVGGSQLVRLGLDGFTETGTPEQLRERYGLSTTAIRQHMISALRSTAAAHLPAAVSQ